MVAVVVSSPGRDASPHWSEAAATRLITALVARGAEVLWLLARHEPPTAVPRIDGATAVVHSLGQPASLGRVAATQRHAALEQALSTALRQWPRAPVAHLGIGARGSPSVLWLADRLGSPAFGALRGEELLCSRGTLVDRDGSPCQRHDDPQRCRWCCAGPWWSRRPRSIDFANRNDLLAASLMVAALIQVPDERSAASVAAAGVQPARILVAAEVESLVDRMLDGPVRG